VIGGGNVAIDVGRTARRLGAECVTLACLESRVEMPASPWEIEEAQEEGIRIVPSRGPRRVFNENGKVKGLELNKCAAVFDAEGRFRPEFDDSDVATILADNVILAVGQQGDLDCLEGSRVELDSPGRMRWQRETLASSLDGVFACGEVVAGPGSAVEAVFEGHRAARSIVNYLEHGQPLAQPSMPWPRLGELPNDVAERVTTLPPSEVDIVPAEARVRDFSEIDRVYTEAEALAEAKRCIACTTGALADEHRCAACLTCVRICPFGVATVDKTAVMPAEKCQACGLCAAYCPAAAIALKRFSANQMQQRLRSLVNGRGTKIGAPLIVSYCCLFELSSREFARRVEEDFVRQGVLPIMVPCVARLSVADLLSPFEVHAEAVVVIACRDGSCLYPTAERRLLDRVRQAKQILEEIRMEPERIDYWKTDGRAETSWTAFWQFSRHKIRQIRQARIGGLP